MHPITLSPLCSWYDDSHVILFDSATTASWSGNLIGVAEYNNNPSDDPIVIKLESGGGGDWFIGFNRAYGPNADNVQADNLVTIYNVMDGNGDTYSTSSLKGVLRSGQSSAITDWRNTGSNLVITVKEINLQARPGYASIDIEFGGTQPPQPPAPGPGSLIALLVLVSVAVSACLCCGPRLLRRNKF